MTTREITMMEAVDLAVDKLGPLRRSIVKRRFNRFPQEKLDCCERCMLAAMSDTRMKDIGLASLAQGFASGSTTAETPFSIDLDQLEKFLQLVLEYLPKILEIILPLFISLLLPFALVLCLAGSASAQCVDGTCQLSRAVPLAAPTLVEGQPVRNVARVVTTPVVRVASMPVMFAENVATAIVEEKPVRSFVASRPLARLVQSRPVRSFFAGRQPVRNALRALFGR